MVKDLEPKYADLVTSYTTHAFFTHSPTDIHCNYIKELILRYGAVGIFKDDEQSPEPIGWSFRKNGKYRLRALR